VVRFLGILITLLLSTGLLSTGLLSSANAIASTLVCDAPLYPDKEWPQVTRFLEKDGQFSFETYWSESAPGFYPTFWMSTSHASTLSGATLKFQILDGVVKKLKKDSLIEISNGNGISLVARRRYEDSANRQFELPLDTLFKQFGNSGKLELKLVNGPKGTKPPFSGTLDLTQLAKEATLLPAAQTRLDALQSDYRTKCKPLIEPDAAEEPANWSCTNSTKDKLGEYFADGDSVGSVLRLGKTAEIRWYGNMTTGSLNWFKSKVSRNLTTVRFKSGSFKREPKSTLPRAHYDTSFDVPFSLSEAILLKDDLLIQALDAQGNILDQATLPAATLAHVAVQLEILKAKSIQDRNDYKNRCEPPQEIVVT
jgi:hypothetical protein